MTSTILFYFSVLYRLPHSQKGWVAQPCQVPSKV